MNSKNERQRRKIRKRVEIAENNLLRQKKFCDDREQKMFSLDENTQTVITGRIQIRLRAATKVDNMEVKSAITKIVIPSSAAHERRGS